MTAPVLEAVPNFSEGRDAALVEAIARAAADAGAEVLDWSADPDHHRSVVTFIGTPAVVEEAAVATARVAVERIDLRRHRGVHPRIGALDVLPFVPLVGLSPAEARESAWRVGRRLVDELGIPVYFYGWASEPPGRPLRALRKGGFETLVAGWPAERVPDLLPAGWMHAGAHPSAGVTCVGARDVLLAWNVVIDDVPLAAAAAIARTIRESGGGLPGLRALALELPARGIVQISMNLEDVRATSPMAVYRRIEELVHEAGGRVRETEIIGMIPDELLFDAAVERLRLGEITAERVLSRRLVRHVAERNRD